MEKTRRQQHVMSLSSESPSPNSFGRVNQTGTPNAHDTLQVTGHMGTRRTGIGSCSRLSSTSTSESSPLFYNHRAITDKLQVPETSSISSSPTPSVLSASSTQWAKHSPVSNMHCRSESVETSSRISDGFRKESIDKIIALGFEETKENRPCPLLFMHFAGPKLPFCEDYDGVNKRKTKTISESIMAILACQETETRVETPVDATELEVAYRSSVYFDRLKEIHDIIEATTDPVKCELASNPVHMWAYSCPSPALTPVIQDPEPKCLNEERDHRCSRSSSCLFAEMSSEGDIENMDVGSVDLKVKYFTERETIQVTIIKAEDVFDPNDIEKSINPFVKVSIYQRNHKKKRTSVVKKSRNPVYQEVFQLNEVVEKWLHVTCLLVELYHKKQFGSRRLGGTLIWLDELDLIDRNEELVTDIFRTSLY